MLTTCPLGFESGPQRRRGFASVTSCPGSNMSDAAPPVGAVMLPSRLVLMSGLGSVTLDSCESSERPCGARHPARRGSPRGRAPGSEPDTGSVPRMQRGAVMAGSGPHLPRTGAPRIRSTSGNPYFITEKPMGPRVAPARSRSQQSRDHAPPAPPPQRAARCMCAWCCLVAGPSRDSRSETPDMSAGHWRRLGR